jgi:hypothetical protein
MLAEHGADQIAIAVDGTIQVAPVATNLRIRFVYVPRTPSGSTSTATRLSKFGGRDGGELRFLVANGFVAEDDPALQEHLAEVLQREPVA